MLAEIVEYLATPCPKAARRLGYLTEAVAIRARHRRCRHAWHEHLENCRAAVMEAARSCSRRDTVLIAGSGALLDLPVRELSGLFRQVILFDIVHPWTARLRTLALSNVRLDTADATGILEDVASGRMPKPAPTALYRDQKPDLVVSANILSQLALMPVKRLKAAGTHSPEELAAYAGELQSAHLAWLAGFTGTRLLLTDTHWSDGVHGGPLLEDLALPEPWRTWTWAMAPRPEIHPDRDVSHRVAAFLLPPA